MDERERERDESDFIRFDVETGPSGGSRSDEREMSIFFIFLDRKSVV